MGLPYSILEFLFLFYLPDPPGLIPQEGLAKDAQACCLVRRGELGEVGRGRGLRILPGMAQPPRLDTHTCPHSAPNTPTHSPNSRAHALTEQRVCLHQEKLCLEPKFVCVNYPGNEFARCIRAAPRPATLPQ